MSVKYRASSRQFEVDSPKHLRMDKDTKPTMCRVKFMKCKVTRVYFTFMYLDKLIGSIPRTP